MHFSLITENYFSSSVNFTQVDEREPLYATNNYQPTSSESAIVWQDLEGGSAKRVGPIVDCGDLSVSSTFAEKLMSFDPYGVEVYPSKLKLYDGELEGRYIIATNNVIDVLDEDKSRIKVSPRSGDLIVHELYLSAEKLRQIPLQKRVAFRVKGADTTIFYCEELFDAVVVMPEFDMLRKVKVSTNKEAPKI
jgi:hypothetical protein